jgi:hypothetical protein
VPLVYGLNCVHQKTDKNPIYGVCQFFGVQTEKQGIFFKKRKALEPSKIVTRS